MEIPGFHKMARDAGRDPASIEITSFGLARGPRPAKATQGYRCCSRRADVPPEKSDKVMPIIDRWTKLMQQVNG